eukprot:PhF_6_TR9177/c1_g1_i1/m.14303/K06893/K06893; uncharacterized protein
MAAKARTLTERFWGSIDQGDYDGLTSLFHNDCEIVYPGQSSMFSGVYKGRAGAEVIFKKLFVEVSRSSTDVELLENDDKNTVISAVTESGQYKGKPYSLKWLLMFVTKGDAIVRAEIYTDTELAGAIFPK